MCNFINSTRKETFKTCPLRYVLHAVKHSSIVLWLIMGIQSPNDPCYIYFLLTMTYFVKVTRLN